MLKKDPSKKGVIENFRTNTLYNAKLKILTKVLANRLGFVVDKLVGEAQTCTVQLGLFTITSILFTTS